MTTLQNKKKEMGGKMTKVFSKEMAEKAKMVNPHTMKGRTPHEEVYKTFKKNIAK
jgi:hypothetical protein